MDHISYTKDNTVLFSTLMETKSHIVNAYSGITFRNKRISGSVKLKADYLNDGDGTLIKERGREEEHVSQTGFNLTPEANINVLFPQSTFSNLSFKYLLQKYRPNIQMLSAYADYSNPNLIFTGNPELKQEAIHRIVLSTRVKRVSIGVNYAYSDNKISPYWYENDNGAVVQSYRNYGKYQSYGLNSMINYYKIPFNIIGTVFASYSNENAGAGETSNSFNAHAVLNAGYMFKNKLNLSAQAGYFYFRNSGYRDVKTPPVSLSFTAKKSFFNERLEVEARISDILNIRHKTTTNIHSDDFTLRQRIEKRRLPLELTMGLRIGSFKVKPIKKALKGAVIDDVSGEN